MPGKKNTRRMNLQQKLLALPKAELHVHLDGSLRPETLIDLALEAGVTLPAGDVAALQEYMHVRDAKNLVEYLERFDTTVAVMQSADALERVAYELADDLAEEGVWYAEIRFSPILHTQAGLLLEDVVEAVLRGLQRARRDVGIQCQVIICGIRNMDPQTSQILADLTVAFKTRGVVAFDLAGAEYNYPAKKHRKAFYTVLDANMAATIHAGEAYGPESIHQALHYCGAHRIGHGTRLFEDRDLMRYVIDFRVPIEICLTSNVQTRAVQSFEEHPFREYFDEGMVVSLNTDNRLMSRTTVVDEYLRAHDHLGFEWSELAQVARMSFEAAFLPWQEKVQTIERFDAATGNVGR